MRCAFELQLRFCVVLFMFNVNKKKQIKYSKFFTFLQPYWKMNILINKLTPNYSATQKMRKIFNLTEEEHI